MGFIKKLLTAGPAMNRLAKTCSKCLDCIRLYDNNLDFDYIITAAWLYTYGIQNSLEKWGWNPITAKIIIPGYSQLGRVSLHEAIIVILSKIKTIAEENDQIEIIDDIMDEGKLYNHYSYMISTELKNKLKP